MTGKHGVDLFKTSVDLRLLCCNLRKVRPLTKHLHSLDAWVTGLRRDQWASRTNIRKVEIDHDHGAIVKLNPLAEWTEDEVWDYIREREVPYHSLYDQGYKSIGCAPCTRATAPDEPSRAGRWWWETNAPKECGIHCSIESGGLEHELHALLEGLALTTAVRVTGEAAEVARAEAQAVLAMVQDETRRGRLADVVAAVDGGEVEGDDADALAELLELGLATGRVRAVYGPGGRAGRAGALPPAAARTRADRVGARSERGARGPRGPHDRSDLGQRGRTWRIWSDDLDGGLRGRASARTSRSPTSNDRSLKTR